MQSTDPIDQEIERTRQAAERQRQAQQFGQPLGTSGSSLPSGDGRYKVLQLDASSRPHWDWVRAHA